MPSIFSDLEFLWEPGTKPGELLTLQKTLNEAGGRDSMPCHGEIAKSWASQKYWDGSHSFHSIARFIDKISGKW
jgi:hypothetical protein